MEEKSVIAGIMDDCGVRAGISVRNFMELRLATVCLLAEILKTSADFEEEIKKTVGRKYKGNLKEAFMDILHDWVDELYESDEELRQIRQQ